MNATAMDRNHLHRMYGKQAPRYDRAMRFWKRVVDIRKGRAWARGDVRGDVLELGVGTGLNLPYYSEDVDLTARLSGCRCPPGAPPRPPAVQATRTTPRPRPDPGPPPTRRLVARPSGQRESGSCEGHMTLHVAIGAHCSSPAHRTNSTGILAAPRIGAAGWCMKTERCG